MPLPVTLAGKKNWGLGVRGLASPDPLLGSGGDSACAYCWGIDRGVPVPQIMLERGA